MKAKKQIFGILGAAIPMNDQTQKTLSELLDQIEQRANAATPGPWHYEQGGGHASNRIVGAVSVQTNGWPERINGISNASYSDRICENLGDDALPHPSATINFIAAARSDVPALVKALRRAVEMLEEEYGPRSDMSLHNVRKELAQLLREPADSVRAEEEKV